MWYELQLNIMYMNLHLFQEMPGIKPDKVTFAHN